MNKIIYILLLLLVYLISFILSSFIIVDYLSNIYQFERDDFLFGGIYVYEDNSLLVSSGASRSRFQS